MGRGGFRNGLPKEGEEILGGVYSLFKERPDQKGTRKAE